MTDGEIWDLCVQRMRRAPLLDASVVKRSHTRSFGWSRGDSAPRVYVTGGRV
jgi:hypothetical protein